MKKWIMAVTGLFVLAGCSTHEPVNETKKTEPISQTEQKETISWNGTYTRPETFDGGKLVITNQKEKAFDFNMQVNSGGHVGEIDGSAELANEKATFSDGEDCKLTFIPKKKGIDVQATDGCMTGYGGMGVDFNGTFQKGKVKPPSRTLAEVDVLTPSQDKTFHALVGKDYTLFTDRFQLLTTTENVDDFEATVVSGGVRGLFTIMEAIIMVTPDQKIYAAVIDDEEVRYYTNDETYREDIPKTILAWHQRFNELPFTGKRP